MLYWTALYDFLRQWIDYSERSIIDIATPQKTPQQRRRATIVTEILLALFTAALIMGGFIRILPTLIRQPGSYDFAAYYVAARVLNAQDVLYDDARMADAATIGSEKVAFPRYIYPPFFAALLRPLATLPFITASRIWFVFNLVCLWSAIGLLARLVRTVTSLGDYSGSSSSYATTNL